MSLSDPQLNLQIQMQSEAREKDIKLESKHYGHYVCAGFWRMMEPERMKQILIHMKKKPWCTEKKRDRINQILEQL